MQVVDLAVLVHHNNADQQNSGIYPGANVPFIHHSDLASNLVELAAEPKENINLMFYILGKI